MYLFRYTVLSTEILLLIMHQHTGPVVGSRGIAPVPWFLSECRHLEPFTFLLVSGLAGLSDHSRLSGAV